MKDKGLINSLQFGLGGSQIRLGGFNLDMIEQRAELKWIETVDGWSFETSQIKVG